MVAQSQINPASKVKFLTYKNVLIDHNLSDKSAPFKFCHLSDFSKFADELGYPFLLWNEIVFQKEDNGRWMRTPWTEINIQ